MNCTITPDMDASVKIDILIANAAMNMYRKDVYGMSTCKIGYEYSYLADLKFLLEREACTTCTQVEERINTL